QAARKFSLELVDHLIRGLALIVIFRVSVWTLIIWLLYVGQVALILLWAAQLELTLTAVLVIFVVSGIGMNLAASPGGLGVYEAAIVVSASWFGVGREEALASAIVLHVIQYMPSTVLGLLLMSRVNISYKQAKSHT
ncbi:MAG: flippase-like domain-containing protein, partial [Gammaproteobacteria bacterium]|nr:flippase-like domain-containing protein [Gammaproteobacteria bacterium]